IKEGTEYIFSVGGDGTANVLIQELAGPPVRLLIIPTGTANDLAGELGISRNIKKIITMFQNRQIEPIDLININGKYMITNGGIGLASDVATSINTLRSKFPFFRDIMRYTGDQIYSMILGFKITKWNFPHYNIKIESSHLEKKIIKVKTPMLFINNQPTLAGKFNLAPATCNQDGKFNVTIFTHQTRKSLIQAILSIKKGNFPINDPDLIFFETDNVKLTNLDKEQLMFFGDGEQLVTNKTFNITINPNFIHCFCFKSGNIQEHSYGLDMIEAF
ncbi:MAG: hypothetical protein A2328_12025, partial [Bdellovibrionales bacterium RIFOXYB2_FULL_36_6]